MTEAETMIDYILQQLRAHGVDIPDQVRQDIKVAVCEGFGGERVYVPKLPKLQGAARVAKASRVENTKQVHVALATGLSVRQVRRLTRGR